jgi:hypothetical protein
MKPSGYPLPKLRTLFVTKVHPKDEACRLRQGGKGGTMNLLLTKVNKGYRQGNDTNSLKIDILLKKLVKAE